MKRVLSEYWKYILNSRNCEWCDWELHFFIMFENLVVDLYSNCWLSMRCTHIRRTGSDRGPALAAVGPWSATDIERHLSKFSQLQKEFFLQHIKPDTPVSLSVHYVLKVFLAILIVKTWPFYFLYLRFLFVKSFLCLLHVLSKKKPSFWMVHIELWCTKLNNWNTISWYKTQLYQVMTIAC